MITGELKNKVDKIWEVFWTGGITNPLEVIEQFTYLLFIKQLDDVETTKESEAGFLGLEYQGMFPPDCQEYRWSRFKNLGDAQEIYDIVLNGVFPFIKNLHQDKKIAGAAHEAGKGIVVIVNKWDLIEKETNTMRNFRKEIAKELTFMSYAPTVFISVLEKQRLQNVLATAKAEG